MKENVKVYLKNWIYLIMQQQIKNATDVDASDFAKKTDLANLEPVVGKLDIDKFLKCVN